MSKKPHQLIKKLRKQEDYSKSEMSDKLGVSRPTYDKIEGGEKDLTIPQAKKLSEIFGIGVNNIISGELPDDEVNLSEKEDDNQEMRVNVPQKNYEKFREVLLYILDQVGAKPNVGETVLYKLLYFIDLDYYEKYEEQLMGLEYIKNHHGPTPKSFKKVIEQMEQRDEVEQVDSEYFDYEQKKYLPHRQADLDELSGKEKEYIDKVLARLSDKTATELSNLTQKDVPWVSASEGEAIEYESVFYRGGKIS
jgi:transcriptional regulator with XRE-family HTH domain